MSTPNPCLTCGACCARYRASSYRAEADDATSHRRAMKGTDGRQPRCVAPAGEIGGEVRCPIYADRSSTCRDFDAARRAGRPAPLCDRARARHGLPPLKPADRQPLSLVPDSARVTGAVQPAPREGPAP